MTAQFPALQHQTIIAAEAVCRSFSQDVCYRWPDPALWRLDGPFDTGTTAITVKHRGLADSPRQVAQTLRLLRTDRNCLRKQSHALPLHGSQ